MVGEVSYSNQWIKLHSLQKERELICKVRLGDAEEANKTFRELLTQISKTWVKNSKIVKIRVLELTLVLSRAAVDGGADFGEVSQINTKFIQKIEEITTLEEIVLAAQRTLELYMSHSIARKPQTEQTVGRIKQYILKNYDCELTLEEIARSVYLSPWHVSRLFKQAVGIPVMEYVTQVRVEKAKLLLRNPDYSIYEIAEKLGYKEPGYFSKVFRRKEGRTPRQFRQLG